MTNLYFRKIFMFAMLFALFQSTNVGAQNLLHYAITTNGARGECLFPEDASGNVVFTDIRDVPCAADTIMMIVDDYIMSKNVNEKCEVSKLSGSTRTSTYSIKMNIGKQLWGIEYWGTPLFAFYKDASVVNFKCIIEARNGKFKYSLVNFETNRNTIRGEAKNDGQPNIIHWQRVNSLKHERDSYASTHDVNKRSVKEELYDFNSQIAYEACLYQAEYDAVKNFEEGLKNLKFEDEFMDFSQTNTDSERALSNAIQGRNFSFSVFGNGFFTQSGQAGSINDSYESKINDSNYNNYRGFLMEKGNNVYVDSGSSIFEQAGAQELIKQIIIDGFWNVVGNRRKAHFVIKYTVNLEGRDKGYVVFTTPREDIGEIVGFGSTSESSNDNRELARDVYLKNIVPLQKKIEAKKYPKKLLQFTR